MVAPLVAAAGIGALGAIGGGLLGSSGAHKANRTALQIWREQRGFMDEMSRTEIQRRVADMTAAGINPMLSVMGMGAASSPNVSPPHIQNEGAASAAGVAQAAQIAASAAQIKLAEAQARKTTAEAGVIESELPWSAANAASRNMMLKRELEMIGSRIDEQINKTDMSFTDAEMKRQLAPFQLDLQKALAKAEQLGLSEKEAVAELYKSMQGLKGAERIIPLLISLIRGGSR